MAKSVNFYVFFLFQSVSIIITNNKKLKTGFEKAFDFGPWTLSVNTWVIYLEY